ncbi:MAG: hypothetical protein LBL09_03525 [Oscillospiraceae bacterium]|nr:hypothetical protein [Oscillospiraceae bacterium]
MDTKRMREKAAEVSALSGKPRVVIFADMILCGFKYQAGYMDYALFEMYSKNRAQRKSILTRGKNNMYVSALNDRKKAEIFDNKPEFLRVFSQYAKRDFLVLDAADPAGLEEFAKKHGGFVVKPPGGTHGDGIKRYGADEISDYGKFCDKLAAGGQTLIEELVIQHDSLAGIYAGAVNTIRTVTILKDGEVHVVTAMLRIGGSGSEVDNFNNGGMVVPVEVKTGKISLPATDKAGNVYSVHPSSGAQIPGGSIPMWEECLELVKRAAKVVPEVRYVGWDVAVTPDGPLLIEGNPFPGHDIYGLPPHTPDGIGILPDFEAVIPLGSLRNLKQGR